MTKKSHNTRNPRSIYFFTKLSDLFGFCTKVLADGVCNGARPPLGNPFCLDLGFSGESTPDLEGGRIIPTSGNPPPPGGPITFLLPRPLLPTFLTAPSPGGPACEEPGLVLALSFAKSSESGEESAPRFCLLAFSCLAWTERKCWRSSCHLISSRPSFDRVEVIFPTVLRSKFDQKPEWRKIWLVRRFWCDMQESGGVDCIKPVSQRDERRTLWKQHQQAVQTLEKVRVFLWLEKLESQV